MSSAVRAGVADPAFRAAVLRAHGAGDAEVAELLAYAENPFAAAAAPAGAPLEDEPFAGAWDGYAADAAERGAFAALREPLVQLRFPVEAGAGSAAAYHAATTRGDLSGAPSAGLALVDPDGLRVWLHATPAGRIPVVAADAREDFVALVRALTRRNEPDPVPDSMGAVIVGGYNNWGRVAALRRAWEAENPGADAAAWTTAFRALIPHKALYQDRFILISGGPYSAVPAKALGLAPDAWRAASGVLRLEHECVHYYTRRVWGSMRNSLHDELIADYQGIRAAAGRYRADWLLRFMGLEAAPAYRAGGRLENYLGDPPLGASSIRVLRALVCSAAANLERIDALRPPAPCGVRETARALDALVGVGLEALASDGAAEWFGSYYASDSSHLAGVGPAAGS